MKEDGWKKVKWKVVCTECGDDVYSIAWEKNEAIRVLFSPSCLHTTFTLELA